MTASLLAGTSASIAELKRDPLATVAAGDGCPVAILSHNEPAFYCVPAQVFEAMLCRLEDIELNAHADSRRGEQITRLSLEDL